MFISQQPTCWRLASPAGGIGITSVLISDALYAWLGNVLRLPQVVAGFGRVRHGGTADKKGCYDGNTFWNLTYSYWKWPFVVDLSTQHGDFP